MNKDLAYILGAIKDGSLPKCKTKFEITFACDWYKLWLENIIKPKISKIFGIKSTKIKIYSVLDRKSDKPYFRLKVYSKDIYKILTSFYSPGKQEFWKTPEAIKNSNLEFQKEYVKGFYDAEGGSRNVDRFLRGETKTINCEIGIKCKHANIQNEPLNFIKNILEKFAIKCSIRKSKDGLVITGKNNIFKFYRNFTPLHPRKRQMIKKLLQYYGVPVSVEA